MLLSCISLGLAAAGDATSEDHVAGVNASLLNSELANVQAKEGVSAEQLKAISSIYDEAKDWLSQADRYKSSTRQFIASRTSAPLKAKGIRESLREISEKKLPRASQYKNKSLEELEQLLETEKATQAAKEARVAELAHLVSLEANRPDAARKQLEASNKQLDELRDSLSTQALPVDSLALAQYRRDQARMLALKNQVAMLEQEMLSHPARLALSKAQLEQAEAEAALAGRQVSVLEDLVNQRRKKEVEQVSKVEAEKEQDITEKYPALKGIAAENARLGKELKETTQALEKASKRDNDLRNQAQRMEAEYRSTQRKVEIAGLREALGQVLLEHRKNLPDPRKYKKQEARLRKHVTETGLRQIRYRELLRRENALEPDPEILLKDVPEAQRSELLPHLKQLLER
ncbi:hypothetical protein, partial [Thiolapillus sp.]